MSSATLSGKSFEGSQRVLLSAETRRGETVQSQLAPYAYVTSVGTEKQLLRNLVVLGVGFVLVFSAFNALRSLQSSLFLETALGLRAMALVYGVGSLSCLYAPAFVQRLTPNWSVVLAFVLVALFVSAFFYPRPYSVLPTAALLGLALGPLFCAQATFLMRLVSLVPSARTRNLGLFSFFLNSSRVWGHLIVALLLRYGGDVYVFSTRPQHPRLHTLNPQYQMTDQHASLRATVARPSLCALGEMSEDDIFRSPTSYVFVLPSNLSLMLVSVFLGMTFLGVAAVTTLLDKFDLYLTQDPLERSPLWRSFRKVSSALIDPQLRLLVPLMLFMGLEQGFFAADFTRSFVSCALGLEALGYTLACAGATGAAGALAAQHLSSRHWPTLAALAALAGLLAVLRLWTPAHDDAAVFYVVAAGWGLCHSICEATTITYLASTFTEDWLAAFSAYFLVESAGLATAFVLSPLLVTRIKVYILSGALACAFLPYGVLTCSRRHKQRERTDQI